MAANSAIESESIAMMCQIVSEISNSLRPHLRRVDD